MMPAKQFSIFCVGNGGFVSKGKGLYTNQHTARFLVELSQIVKTLTFCQSVSMGDKFDSLNDYNLTKEKEIRLLPLQISRGSKIQKFISYVFVIPKILKEILKTDFLYLFFPGNLPVISAVLAIILKKRYGIYLRGELGIDNRFSQTIMSNSNFVLCAGDAVCIKARNFCSDVETVTPMIDLSLSDVFLKEDYKKKGPWQLLYVGRVEKRKGIRELIEAVSYLHKKGVVFHLNIIGGAGSEGDFTSFETAVPINLKDKVSFAGMVSDRQKLFQLYRESDIFVFPSHDEGFPRVIYEAMALGVPIITTFVGGIPYVMKNKVNCLRVNVGDSSDIADKIMEMLNSLDLRRKLAYEANLTIREVMLLWKRSHAMQVFERMEKSIND